MRYVSIVATAVALAAGTAVLCPGTASAAPAEFLTKAIKGDNSEATLGTLAARRGHSAAARSFGRMLASDHRAARAKAIPIAARHGIKAPTEMADEAKVELGKLQGLSGPAFDHEFGRYMVEDHRKDIADFEKEASSKDPADIRHLASTSIPVLRKHLETARSVR